MRNSWRRLLLGMGLMIMVITGCAKSDADSSRTAEEDRQIDGEGDAADGNGEIGTAKDAGSEEQAGAGGNEQTDEKKSDGVTGSGEDDAGQTTEILHLEGVRLSILGDSISSFDGWIPEGFNVFYPLGGEVTDVSQTWWMQLLDSTGMELCANSSSSGSTCVGDSLSEEDPGYGCSGYRISFLMGSGGVSPDVIIVYMGTNDLLMSVPIGDNDGTRLVDEGEIENFSDAYCMILDKLASDYPAAQVYCCNLTQVGDWSTDTGQAFVPFVNGLGLTAEDYSDQIRIIADNKGVPLIDLYHCGIEIANLQEMTSDGVHPTPKGMGCLLEAVLKGMSSMADR